MRAIRTQSPGGFLRLLEIWVSGSRDGYTTVLARSNQAKGLVERAIDAGYFTQDLDSDGETTIKAIEEMAQRKYERGLKNLEELGLNPEDYR